MELLEGSRMSRRACFNTRIDGLNGSPDGCYALKVILRAAAGEWVR